MKRILLLLLFCGVSSSVKHSLKFFITATSGVNDELPRVLAEIAFDDIRGGFCDSSSKTVKIKMTWLKDAVEKEPQLLQWSRNECFQIQPISLKGFIDVVRQSFHRSEGVNILQLVTGCERDDETGEVIGFLQFGYDGEDYLSFDLKTQSWIALKPQAVSIKLLLDTDKERTKSYDNFYNHICPEYLKKYFEYGKSSLLRTELPSVSLLQKSPSSPVFCHATGFYPEGAILFWRRDGEELHEDTNQGEVLPNHDGTFQTSSDLNVSSVAPEDWGRYDCVFQLSGVKEDLVIRLDEAVIQTNRVKPSNWIVFLLAALVVLTLVSAAVLGFIVYKKKRAVSPPPTLDIELLDPET